MNIKSYSIVKPGMGRKQHAVYANAGNTTAPLIYLQRPKWVPEGQWEAIVNSIRLELPAGYEIG